MNSLVVFLAVVACALAQKGAGNLQLVGIVRQASDLNADGSYQWSFETENGIAAREQGALKNVPDSKEPGNSAEGQYTYTAPDNSKVEIAYTADERGFIPQGNVLPVAPPTPPAILRLLEWLAAHPESEQQQRKL